MMTEASWSSLWFSIRGWFSPAVLFLLLNLVIGTIALTSKTLRSRRRGDDDDPRPICRGPSAVLERLRSIGLYRFRSGDFPLDAAPPSPPGPQSEPPEAPDAAAGGEQLHFGRSQSDSREAPAEEKERKLGGRMKKSPSENSALAHFEDSKIVRRPAAAAAAAARGRAREVIVDEELEVNVRADDFINRFKQELKLQRLDSIMKYTDMLNRGK